MMKRTIGKKTLYRAQLSAWALMGAILLGGCGAKGSSGPADNPSDPTVSQPPADPISVDLTVMSSSSFDAFIYKDSLWVRGSHPIDLQLNSPSTFVRYARETDQQSPTMDGLWVMDNTICFETKANPIPSTYTTSTPGEMTLCFGPANLNGAYSSYPIRFSSPPFSSADLPPLIEAPVLLPFMGAVMRIDQLQPAGLFLDTSSTVSQQTVTCSDDGTKLTCPTFEVTY